MSEKISRTKTKSYRFSQETLRQIDFLVERENKQAQIYGYKAKTQTEIIEEAIQQKYISFIDPDSNMRVYEQIGQLMDDKLRLALSGFDKSLNHIMYEQLKSNEYWNVLMQTAFNKNVPDDKVNEIVQTENKWNFEIELKLADTFKRK